VLLLCAVGGAACGRKADLVPEPQRFALACPGFEPAWPPPPSAPPVVLDGFRDLRFGRDTVGWALAPEDDIEVEDEADYPWWSELLTSIVHSMLGLDPDPLPLVAVPDGISVLRWDLTEELRRAGYRVLDAAREDSVPPAGPRLGGDIRRIESFYSPGRRSEGDSLVALLAIELFLRGESPVPQWRRRFEAVAAQPQGWQPERGDMEWLVGQAWCDLLAQVGEAFREREFSAAVAREQ
jgi:hypothetical protein